MQRLALTTFVLLVFHAAGEACSVPVFRYALEQWPASKYDILVFHRGPLTEDQRKLMAELRPKLEVANAVAVPIDLVDPLDPKYKALWELEAKDTPLPRVLLRYPESGPKIASVWSGSLAEVGKLSMLVSPTRQFIFDRLTVGNAGVVLLLLSGDSAADEQARSMLRKEIPRITSGIEAPVLTAEGPQVQSRLPLKIAFPVIEVPRNPEEEILVRILLGSEDGLDKVKGPIAFPVFGRGRALCSLHGNDLQKPGELQRSLEYLCRACSCQVKELNPGIDLLISGRWESIFDAELGPKPRDMVPASETRPSSIGGPIRAEMRSAPPRGYNAVEVDDEETNSIRPRWLHIGTFAAAILFFASGVWVLRSRRPSPPDPS